MMRESGVLMPVSSLPGPYGIGCFGKEAFQFVDFLAAAGQSIWQILPLSPTGYGDSPYQSCSAFAGNPYFIDLDALAAEGLLRKAKLKKLAFGASETQIDYGALYTARYPVLREAYAAWQKKNAGVLGCAAYYPDDYYAFTLQNEAWLDDYALYMALKTANGMKSWQEWPAAYRSRDPQALAAFAAENQQEIGFWKFLQYEFAKQWQALKAYANERGVQILGDIPIYVSADSVDAWAGGALFELDAQGNFARVAGCPPDYFSADGQLWGNPLYDWEYHRQTGYAWWVRRVRHALGIYDLLRIDHFRGFDTYWAIPAGSATARTGQWEQGPGMDLFRALEAALGKLPIIAEDLGELFPSVRQLLADSTFPGMKVLQFAFSGQDSEYLPHNYCANCVVYPGTHDNTTLADWWENGDPAQRRQVAAYLHLTAAARPTAKQVAAVDADTARIALLRAALGSAANRAIIPMYEWLGLGAEAHLNTPGKLGGNWAWRAAPGFGTAALAKTMREECAIYFRTVK
jgi:4-alpha-glucanotransferase